MPVHLFGQSADMSADARAGRRVQPHGHRGRGPGHRRQRITAARSAASATSAASRSSRARTSAASATAGSSPPTTTRWPTRLRLLRNHGMEPKYFHHTGRRQLPPRCHPGRGAAREAAAPGRLDRRRAAPTRRAIAQLFAGRRPRRNGARCRSSAPDRTHIYNQFVIRVAERDALRAASRRRRHRHRDLLPGAVPPAGVLRRPRLQAGRLPGGRSRRPRSRWRCRSIPN